MQNPLEDYLNEVSGHLRGLPAAQRDQEIEEMRAHLEGLVAANIELGDTEEEAIKAAIRQFGGPREVGVDLVRAWRRGRWTAWQNSICGIAVLVSLFLASPALFATALVNARAQPNVLITMTAPTVWHLVAGIAAGWYLGWRLPKRAWLATPLATTLAVLLWQTFPPILRGWSVSFHWLGLFQSPQMLVMLLTTWVTITMMSLPPALAASWWARRRQNMPPVRLR